MKITVNVNELAVTLNKLVIKYKIRWVKILFGWIPNDHTA